MDSIYANSRVLYIKRFRSTQYTILQKLFKLIPFILKTTIIPIFNFMKAWAEYPVTSRMHYRYRVKNPEQLYLYMDEFAIAIPNDCGFYSNFRVVTEAIIDDTILFTIKSNFILLEYVMPGTESNYNFKTDDMGPVNRGGDIFAIMCYDRVTDSNE